MVICGYDLSMNGSGICVLELDDNLDVKSCDYLGFTQVKKNEIPDHSIYYKKEDYKSRYELTEMMIAEITKKTENVSYVGIEDFAFGAMGRLADIGSFVGQVAYDTWKRGKAIKWYGPAIHKKFFCGRGNADKIGMYQEFITRDEIKPDISKMPVPTKSSGVSPTSDIIDAYSIAKLVQAELKIQNGIITLNDLSDKEKEVFLDKKKKTILTEPWIQHDQSC